MQHITVRKELFINQPFEKVIDFAINNADKTTGKWRNEIVDYKEISGKGKVGTKADMTVRILGENVVSHMELTRKSVLSDQADDLWQYKMNGLMNTELTGSVRTHYERKGAGTNTVIEYETDCDKNEAIIRQVQENMASNDLANLKLLCENELK